MKDSAKDSSYSSSIDSIASYILVNENKFKQVQHAFPPKPSPNLKKSLSGTGRALRKCIIIRKQDLGTNYDAL